MWPLIQHFRNRVYEMSSGVRWGEVRWATVASRLVPCDTFQPPRVRFCCSVYPFRPTYLLFIFIMFKSFFSFKIRCLRFVCESVVKGTDRGVCLPNCLLGKLFTDCRQQQNWMNKFIFTRDGQRSVNNCAGWCLRFKYRGQHLLAHAYY